MHRGTDLELPPWLDVKFNGSIEYPNSEFPWLLNYVSFDLDKPNLIPFMKEDFPAELQRLEGITASPAQYCMIKTDSSFQGAWEKVYADLLDSKLALDPDTKERFHLCIQEMYQNARRNGNGAGTTREYRDRGQERAEVPENWKKPIRIETLAAQHFGLARVTDKGQGFDLSIVEKKKDIDPLELLLSHGRGLYFLHQYMDKFFYHMTDSGFAVSMIKYAATQVH